MAYAEIRFTGDASSAVRAANRTESSIEDVDRAVGRANVRAAMASRSFKGLSGDVDKSGRSFTNAASGMQLFNSRALGLRNTLGLIRWPAIIASVGSLAGVLGAAATAATGLVGALTPLSGALAAIPVGLSAVAQGMGTVKLAFRDLEDAISAETAEDFAEALKKLSPEAAKFAKEIRDLKPLLAELQGAAGRDLFPGLTKALDTLADSGLFNVVKKNLRETGGVIGELAQQGAKMLASGPWKADLDTLMQRNTRTIGQLGKVGLSLADAFRNIALAAGPLVNWLGQMAVKGAKAFAEWAQGARESGELARMFERTKNAIKLVAEFLGNLARVFMDVTRAARPFGQEILRDLTEGLGRLHERLASPAGQRTLTEYFRQSMPTIREVGRLIRDLTLGLLELGRNTQTAGFIRTLRTELLPVILEVIRSTSGQFGQAFLDFFTTAAKTIGLLAGSNGPLTLFLKVITSIIDGFNKLLETVPGLRTAIFDIGGAIAVIAGLRFLGAITGLTKIFGLLKNIAGIGVGAGLLGLLGGRGRGGAAAGAGLGGLLLGAGGGAAAGGITGALGRLGPVLARLGPWAAAAGIGLAVAVPLIRKLFETKPSQQLIDSLNSLSQQKGIAQGFATIKPQIEAAREMIRGLEQQLAQPGLSGRDRAALVRQLIGWQAQLNRLLGASGRLTAMWAKETKAQERNLVQAWNRAYAAAQKYQKIISDPTSTPQQRGAAEALRTEELERFTAEMEQLGQKAEQTGRTGLKIATESILEFIAATGRMPSRKQVEIFIEQGKAEARIQEIQRKIDGLKQKRAAAIEVRDDATSRVKRIDDQIQGLRDRIVQIKESGAKDSEKRVAGLRDRIRELKDKRVAINSNAEAARREVQRLRQEIDRLRDKTVSIRIEQTISQSGNLGQAPGSIYGGNYATGGLIGRAARRGLGRAVAIIAHEGEVVLNPEQQERVGRGRIRAALAGRTGEDGHFPGGGTVTVTPGGGGPFGSLAAALGQAFVNAAKKFLGTPYEWGSAAGRSYFGADPKEFDCSGFVSYLFKKLTGIGVNAWTGTWQNYGRAVSAAQRRVGDVVLSNFSGGTAGHVGIYAGNGQVISARGEAYGTTTSGIPSDAQFRRIFTDQMRALPGDLNEMLDQVASQVDWGKILKQAKSQLARAREVLKFVPPGMREQVMRDMRELEQAIGGGISPDAIRRQLKKVETVLKGELGKLPRGAAATLRGSSQALRRALDGVISDQDRTALQQRLRQIQGLLRRGLPGNLAGTFRQQAAAIRRALRGIAQPQDAARVQQIMERMAKAVEKAAERMKRAIASARAAVSSAGETLAGKALEAFDKVTSQKLDAINAKYDSQLAALQSAGGGGGGGGGGAGGGGGQQAAFQRQEFVRPEIGKTPSERLADELEARLKLMEAESTELERRRRLEDVTESLLESEQDLAFANEQLARAYAQGASIDTIVQAQERVRDALRQTEEAREQQAETEAAIQAEKDRAALEAQLEALRAQGEAERAALEKKLDEQEKAFEAAQDAAEQAYEAALDAQQQASDAAADAASAASDAALDAQRASLEAARDAEIAALEDQAAYQREHFEAELQALLAKFAKGKTSAADAQEQLLALFKEYDIPFGEAGSSLGTYFSLGMQEAFDKLIANIRTLLNTLKGEAAAATASVGGGGAPNPLNPGNVGIPTAADLTPVKAGGPTAIEIAATKAIAKKAAKDRTPGEKEQLAAFQANYGPISNYGLGGLIRGRLGGRLIRAGERGDELMLPVQTPSVLQQALDRLLPMLGKTHVEMLARRALAHLRQREGSARTLHPLGAQTGGPATMTGPTLGQIGAALPHHLPPALAAQIAQLAGQQQPATTVNVNIDARGHMLASEDAIAKELARRINPPLQRIVGFTRAS